MTILKSDGSIFVTQEGKPFIGLYFIDEGTNIAYRYKENTRAEASERLYTKSVYETELVRRRLNIPSVNLIPQPFKPQPDSLDYERGLITRYFIKKRNVELSITEVTQETFFKLQLSSTPNTIDESIYVGTYIEWRLTGDKKYVTDFNKQQVQQANKTVTGLLIKLNDLNEFYRYS
jgi:hypothetical protein